MEKNILSAILSCSGYKLTDDEKFLFNKYQPFGICLFGRNIKDKKQIKSLCKEIREATREDIFITIDQEGGRVRRLTEPHFRSYAANIEIGSLPISQSQIAAKLHAGLISQDLKDCTINTNFAPVLDIIHPNTTPALKSRCFSNNEKTVANLGKIMVQEYINNGIIPCIKHMPGHGRTDTDSHLNLPILKYSTKELAKDFFPFKENAHCPFGMTAHILLPEIDDESPLTMSKKGISTIIRGEIGFAGILISDSLEMHALKGSLAERVEKSQEAGCDIICYSQGKLEDLQEICQSSKYLSDKLLNKIANIKKLINNKLNIDIEKASAEYKKLFKEMQPYQETYDATEVLNKLQRK